MSVPGRYFAAILVLGACSAELDGPISAAPFNSTVTGSVNTAVTWLVQEPGGGSISASGLYTAPSADGTYHVVAVCQADPSISAAATVIVSAAAALSISPNPATIAVGGTQQFTVVPSQSVNWAVTQTPLKLAPAYPLRASPSGRYMEDRSGLPFRLHGEAAWAAVANLTGAEQDTYLADRASRGFNVVLASLFERRFAAKAPNLRDGTPPFTTPGDLSTVNPAYLDFAAAFVDKAASRGIAVLLDVMYLGYGGAGSSEGWYDTVASSTTAACQALGTAIGRAFAGRPNVVWVIGGDYTLGGGGLDPTVSSRLRTIRAAIAGAGATQPWTAHWGPESTSGSVNDFNSLIDLNGAYSYADPGGYARSAYTATTVRPAFLFETYYENEHGQSRQAIRSFMWRGYLGSIAGSLFGASPVWPFGSAPSFATSSSPPYDSWQHALAAPGSLDFQRMGMLLDAFPWQLLVPSGLGGSRTLVTSGVAAAATGDGRLLVAYVSSGSVTVDMAAMSDSVRARWYDPTTGATREATGGAYSVANSGTRTFSTPGSNGSGAGDWVLLLETAGTPSCGSISTSGLYRAPATAPAGVSCQVTATSKANPSVAASAQVIFP